MSFARNILGMNSNHMNAVDSFAGEISDLQRVAEQYQIEMRASELAREQLELHNQQLEVQQSSKRLQIVTTGKPNSILFRKIVLTSC